MNKFEELVNDFTIMGDDGAVIFSSYDQFLEFVEEIRVDAVNMSQERVDETAKREHEPVAWLWKNIDGHQVLTDDPDYADGTWTPLYTAPPKKEWVGLTDGEREFFKGIGFVGVDIIEARLKEKNA